MNPAAGSLALEDLFIFLLVCFGLVWFVFPEKFGEAFRKLKGEL